MFDLFVYLISGGVCFFIGMLAQWLIDREKYEEHIEVRFKELQDRFLPGEVMTVNQLREIQMSNSQAKRARVHSAHMLLVEAVEELFMADEPELQKELQTVHDKVAARYKELGGNEG